MNSGSVKLSRDDDIKVELEKWIHDSEITGISVDRKAPRSVSVVFELENKKTIKLSFENVAAFECDEFSLQNVVNDFELKSKDNVRVDFVDYGDSRLAILVDKVEKKESRYIHFFPSVGCEIKIIFENVRLYS